MPGRRGHDVHPVYRGDPWAAGTRAPAASADHSGHAPPAATHKLAKYLLFILVPKYGNPANQTAEHTRPNLIALSPKFYYL